MIRKIGIMGKNEEKSVINIAILGAGTVGGGVYKLLSGQKDEIRQQAGADICVKKVLVRDASKERPGYDRAVLTSDWADIVNDDDIDIVVELMGGIEPAKTYVLEALSKGKQVVTANKDLLAQYGEEIGEAANMNSADVLYEAAVAGVIPIIRPLKQSLAGAEITEIMGIVNGTTNYILTQMSETGMSYEDALARATELGYAEADPTADVEGLDAGRKVAIMASNAFHTKVVFSQVYTEGITKITADDIRYAREFGYVIKLLGVARNTDSGIEVKVHPMLIPQNHSLAGVGGSFNAVFLHGKAMDDVTLVGRGAGEMPTATAVLGDIIDVCRDILFDCCGRVRRNCYKKLRVKDISECESKFFIRMQAKDRPGVLANIAGVLGNNGVGISQVVQRSGNGDTAELVIITDRVAEKNFNDATEILGGMSVVKEISGVIRVYDNV